MLRAALRKSAQLLGLDIRRANHLTVDSWRLAFLLRSHRIETVIDVGANTGQFALELLRAGFKGKVVSLEPLPQAHAQLVHNAGAWSNWVIGPAVAIGATTADADFHVTQNSVSSSLLPVLDVHVAAAPQSAMINTIRVPVRRLDEVVAQLQIAQERLFLKIDTQGTERDVLEGASNILPGVSGLKVEMSLTRLYDNQCLYSDLDAQIRAAGFTLWDIVPGFRDDGVARLLQFDGIYFRSAAS